MGSLLLALLLLVMFGAAGWAVWRFGADYLPVEPRRRITAAGIAGCGVVVASLVFFNRLDSPEVAEFVVTTDLNQGAVSYPFMIQQAGVEHVLRIWPQREDGREPQGLLSVRVILSGPGNVTLINEVVTMASGETDLVTADGSTVRGIDWIPWSQNFSPTAAGFYEIALSLPPKAPRVRVRVGARQTVEE
ncbi:MAG: hypothetical protein OEN20_10700 [Gammaproteobacteria bacterium]|nr:hypothetical protein [Gammaproteobacteria bacterium]